MREDIHNFSKFIPLFVTPKKDELFSSWFYRLSRSNYCTTRKFSKQFLRLTFRIRNDYDYHSSENFVNQVNKIVPIEKSLLKELSIKSFNDKLFLPVLHNKPNKWILRKVQFSKGDSKLSFQYCASCRKGYFEKWYRLILFTNCLDCGIPLIERCTICNKPINYLKQDVGRKHINLDLSIETCYHCLQNITGNELFKTSAYQTDIQEQLNWRDLILKPAPNQILYFEVLYTIASGIRYLHPDLVSELSLKFGFELNSISKRRTLNELGANDRCVLFKTADHILFSTTSYQSHNGS